MIANTAQHVNTVVLVGKVLQSWDVGNDRHVRLSVRRPAFYPHRSDGPNDLVTVVLPEAVTRNQVVKNETELHLQGFVRNEDVLVPIGSLVKGDGAPDLPAKVTQFKVRTIVTTVVATSWQVNLNK